MLYKYKPVGTTWATRGDEDGGLLLLVAVDGAHGSMEQAPYFQHWTLFGVDFPDLGRLGEGLHHC